MKRLFIAALVAGILPFAACTKNDPDTSTVKEFDLSKLIWVDQSRNIK